MSYRFFTLESRGDDGDQRVGGQGLKVRGWKLGGLFLADCCGSELMVLPRLRLRELTGLIKKLLLRVDQLLSKHRVRNPGRCNRTFL